MNDKNSTEPTQPQPPKNNVKGAWNQVCGWMQENLFWTVAYVIALLTTVLVGRELFEGDHSATFREWVLFFLATILFFGAVRFVQIFTSCIREDTQKPGQEGESKEHEILKAKELQKIELQKRSWLIFSYSFMLFALFAALLPFVFDVEQRSAAELSKRPIAVFVGCVDYSTDDEAHSREELRCQLVDSAQSPAPGTQAPKPITSLTQQTSETTPKPGEAKTSDTTDTTKTEYAVITNTTKTMPTDTGIKTEVTREITFHRYSKNGMWIINIGGMVNRCNTDIYCVRGGLSVPLYFVILALFGGAISLTRRIPEYQKQAYPKYIQIDEKRPKLQPNQLREYLVFQIVQFISAPFIAVVAYYLVVPESTVVSVTLGFAAGFASETILLMIRAVMDKLNPSTTRSTQFGSISGYIEHNGQPVKDANIRVIGQQGLEAKSDDSGAFVINSVPPGEHVLEIKHTTGTQSKDVRVNSGQATSCHIKL
ncbi:MAG: hypothetical protein AMJ53_03015 [Gammaproteobacteria bacterium SG8_11]|nr:MAG: hypothetical protein AMJ53_03015 [Gammaproteobacteria bacterium SG8_11]